MGEIIFDTDIGTDVDDAYCLAVLAGLGEPRLSAVTTVYGDVGLRAQITRKLLDIMGRADVAVYAGARRPLLSEREIFWGGHEGQDFIEGDEYAAAVRPEPAACFLAGGSDACSASPRMSPSSLSQKNVSSFMANSLSLRRWTRSVKCALPPLILHGKSVPGDL